MLIMTLDPSWRQTLRLLPPGIEPRSTASQVGTLPKELSRQLLCNGWEHYVPYRCLQISNKLCDSTLCTCGGVGGGEQMHNVNYDPGPWRQTLKLPTPGIEPGSHASQAGTLPKELSRQLIPVLRIQDFYPRSRVLIFSHPGSRIQNSNKREG